MTRLCVNVELGSSIEKKEGRVWMCRAARVAAVGYTEGVVEPLSGNASKVTNESGYFVTGRCPSPFDYVL